MPRRHFEGDLGILGLFDLFEFESRRRIYIFRVKASSNLGSFRVCVIEEENKLYIE